MCMGLSYRGKTERYCINGRTSLGSKKGKTSSTYNIYLQRRPLHVGLQNRFSIYQMSNKFTSCAVLRSTYIGMYTTELYHDNPRSNIHQQGKPR